MDDTYIKQGDLVLIKTGKHINECRVLDFSPSGEYIKTGDSLGRHAFWTPADTLVEVLESPNPPDTEYVNIGEDDEDLIGDQWKDVTPDSAAAQDILAKIRKRAEAGFEAAEDEDEAEIEIIQMDKFAELDYRNRKK